MKQKVLILIAALMLVTMVSAQNQTKPRRVKVACVGNSITEGVGSGDSDMYSYPARLQQLLGTEHYRVRNYGKSGHTLMSSADRPWIKTDRYCDLKMWKPEIVIVKLGTNDSKPINKGHIQSDFHRDLLALVDSFQTMPSVKQIFLCTPTPCVQDNRYNIDGEVISRQIVPIIQSVAAERHLRLIDLHSALTGHTNFFPDHVHPNREGAALIAKTGYIAMTGSDAVNAQVISNVPYQDVGLDIHLCIRQSNMAGRAPFTGKSAMEDIGGVFLFNDKEQFEVARNPLNRYSTVRKGMELQRLSIAYMFSKKMHELTGREIGLVCNARGETSIKHWQKGASQGYYEEAVKRTKAAMKYGQLKGIIWHQGEYDCTDNLEEYKQLLAQLISDLRQDLGDNDLPVVVGQISQWNWTKTEAGTQPFNDMIATVSDFIPHTACATSEDLTPAIGEHDPHFSSKSQKTYGARFAEKMRGLCNKK